MMKATSTPSQQTLPSTVQQAAITAQLGRFRQVYPLAPLTKGPLVTGCILLCLGLFFGSMVLFEPAQAATGVFVGSLFGLPGIILLLIYFLVRSREKRPQAYYLFERGFILVRGSETTSVSWDQIQYVGRARKKEVSGGIRTVDISSTYSYLIRRYQAQGWEMQITGRFQGGRELAQRVNQEVFNRQLPKATEAIKGGETVAFGSLSLNQQEVIYVPGNKHLPWSQVKKVTVSESSAVIEAASSRQAWAVIPLAQVPNYSIFVALAERLRQLNQGAN